MELIFLSYLPAVIGLYLIGLASYQNNPHQRVNKLFTMFSVVTASWLLLLLFSDTTKNHDQALWLLRSALFIGSSIGLLFLLFCDSFPEGNKRRLSPFVFKVLLLLTAIFMGLSLTEYMVSDISLNSGGVDIETASLVYTLQSLFVIGQFTAGLALIYLKRKQSSVARRLQIKLFTHGIFIALIVNIVTGFVFIFIDIGGQIATFMTGLSLLIMAGFMWVAVAHRGMFNIRASVSRAVGYVLSVFILAAAYALTVGVIIELYIDSQALRVLLLGLSALVAMMSLRYTKTFFDRLTRHLFHRVAYSSKVKLDLLTDKLVSHIELEKILQSSSTVINDTLKPEILSLAIVTGKNLTFYGQEIALSAAKFKAVSTKKDSILLIDSLPDYKAHTYRSAGIAVIAPLRSNSKLEGYLLLGPRCSGTYYTRYDMNFIKIAAKNIGLAIQGARSYEQVASFNKTLETKIQKATKRLQETNRQLEQLHKSKDDFISMASHQLRPKITAASGFLDLLDRSGLKTNTNQSELLELTGKSMQQMQSIVVDMLDISRMEADAGYLSLNRAETDLMELVESEVSMRAKNSAQNRFKLLSKSLKNQSTIVSIDANKIREVLGNIIENADQYSSKDSCIEVEIKKLKSSLQVLVKDKGVGFNQQEKKRLFEKFYRSDEAKRLRPNGSGIGLYVCKQIIEAHGGMMIVDSSRGKGSTFGFSLPV